PRAQGRAWSCRSSRSTRATSLSPRCRPIPLARRRSGVTRATARLQRSLNPAGTPLDVKLSPLQSPLGIDEHLIHLQRLCDDLERSELVAIPYRARFAPIPDHDDYRHVGIFSAGVPQQLNTIHDGAAEACDNQRGALATDNVHRFESIASQQAAIACWLKDVVHQVTDVARLVDDEDRRGCRVSHFGGVASACRSLVGSVRLIACR